MNISKTSSNLGLLLALIGCMILSACKENSEGDNSNPSIGFTAAEVGLISQDLHDWLDRNDQRFPATIPGGFQEIRRASLARVPVGWERANVFDRLKWNKELQGRKISDLGDPSKVLVFTFEDPGDFGGVKCYSEEFLDRTYTL